MENNWIRIKKGGKKPIRGENVLAATTEWVVSAYWTGRRWFSQFEFPETDVEIYPTHWQPLPLPPTQNR